jgi:catechol 2,3-dioxygenase-like lactoylglutathione lyase family enzyme
MDSLLAFYRTLGLEFVEEQHGAGPVHFAATAGDLIFEIYPASDDRAVDSSTRLGFKVANVDFILVTLQETGYEVISLAKSTEWGYRAVVRDPDGRSVEISQ